MIDFSHAIENVMGDKMGNNNSTIIFTKCFKKNCKLVCNEAVTNEKVSLFGTLRSLGGYVSNYF